MFESESCKEVSVSWTFKGQESTLRVAFGSLSTVHMLSLVWLVKEPRPLSQGILISQTLPVEFEGMN